MISYQDLHPMNNRATPQKIMLYKHALHLHKIYNTQDHNFEWQVFNFQQCLTTRQTNFSTLQGHQNKVGINALANRLFVINGKIPLIWLSLSIDSFKLKCKEFFYSEIDDWHHSPLGNVVFYFLLLDKCL